jgi:hypothetical protein
MQKSESMGEEANLAANVRSEHTQPLTLKRNDEKIRYPWLTGAAKHTVIMKLLLLIALLACGARGEFTVGYG